LGRLQAQLGLHDLAIEDAGKAHQHPEIEQYGDLTCPVSSDHTQLETTPMSKLDVMRLA
jgi:magnesium transporter